MPMALRSVHPVDHGSMAAAAAHHLTRIVEVVSQWHQRAASRRELAQLDDRMLHDIGITSADVDSEVSKPFWKA